MREKMGTTPESVKFKQEFYLFLNVFSLCLKLYLNFDRTENK